MSDLSPSSHLQVLFEAALRDYEKQTGTKLAEHPLARQLETCNSIESVTAVIQGQARDFGEFKGCESKVTKSLLRAVSILYPLSAALCEAVPLVCLMLLMSVPTFLMGFFSFVMIAILIYNIYWLGYVNRSTCLCPYLRHGIFCN